MAGIALCFVAALVVVLLPSGGQAGDAFTGFQIDNEEQYFTYLGLRTPLTLNQSDLQPFVQFFAAGQGYSFKTNGQVRDARVQFLVPSVGLKTDVGSWSLAGLVGPQVRRKEEELVTGGTTTQHEAGVFLQGEAFQWQERGSLHGIISYGDLDQFFWGRLRGKLRVHRPDQGCCTIYIGWDLAGMGNDDVHAVRAGPLVEVPVGQIFWLVKAGYRYDSTFRSGAYTGLEIYLPF